MGIESIASATQKSGAKRAYIQIGAHPQHSYGRKSSETKFELQDTLQNIYK